VRHHRELTSRFTAFLKPLAIIGLAGILLLAEPDYGAVVVLTGTALGVLFVAGARLRDVTLAVVSASAVLGALAYSAEYRIERLSAFLDPWADPFASGFQLTQSLIAIGRGDWLGVGLGQSVQKLFYLPEAHTDFVFAVLAEELGLVGSTSVIVLFGLLVYRAITIGQRAIAAGLPFQGLVSTAIGLTLGVQAFINIGVNTGLLPTKGLTLPLLSYGRSSTVVTLVALGLLARVYYELHGAEQRQLRGKGSE
jgi:cell division protein FtsW